MLRRYILVLLCSLISACITFSAAADEYITINKFLSQNPDEKVLMDNFAEVVSSDPDSSALNYKRTVKIAVVYPALQKSDYWRDNVKAIEARLKALGIRYEILTYFSKPSGDYRLQVLQLTEAMRSKPDYLALSVDNENIKRLVTTVLARQRPKVFIQNLTTPFKDWEATPPYMYVGFDHIKGSSLLAEHYSEIYPKGAKYIILYGSKGTVSSQRGDGFESYSLSRGMVPVAKFYTDFDAEKAYEAVKTVIERGDDFSFVYACSTDIALGASRAIEEAGLKDKILVNGWGGTFSELQLIKSGKLNFTVMRINDDSGVAIAEAIKNDLTGNSIKNPQIFSGAFVTVTKDMPPEEIDKLIERALRYSGK